MKTCGIKLLVLIGSVVSFAAQAVHAKQDYSVAYKTLVEQRSDAIVSVKFVMRFSTGGEEQRNEDRTQGAIVSADGLLLLPDRAVSFDFGSMGGQNSAAGQMVANSSDFRVRLPNSDQWQTADLVTRDSELGLAWLRIRDLKQKLKYIDLNASVEAVPGMTFYTLLRTSDEWGAVPVVRLGRLLGQTNTPRTVFLADGMPGLAFNERGQILGYVDADLVALGRSRGNSGFGLDMSDMMFYMLPAKRIAAATLQAAKLPVVRANEDAEEDSSANK